MLRVRIIPCLLLKGKSLVKTVRFKRFSYIGDPINTCRIFNELEVDELCLLDIDASKNGVSPKFELLSEISTECFMPLSYGGGVRDVATAERIFGLGFEKIIMNTAAMVNPSIISEIAKIFGSQSVVVAIDVKAGFGGGFRCCGRSGTTCHRISPVNLARQMEDQGAGEILLTSIDREGTWEGFDVNLVRQVSDAVSIPVIANGGAGSVKHIGEVVKQGHASAVALGSMVVYQKKGMGVLVNFPDENALQEALS